MSALHVAGYRPLVTRRIGSAAPSAIRPVDLSTAAPSTSVAVEESPPAAGYSNWEAYDEDEVLLADHSACTVDDQAYMLDPPRPLAELAGRDLKAFELQFDDPSAISLQHPSELEDAGHTYRFCGCYW